MQNSLKELMLKKFWAPRVHFWLQRPEYQWPEEFVEYWRKYSYEHKEEPVNKVV